MEFVFQNTIFFVQLALVAINMHLYFAGADIGVIYGMQGDDIPDPDNVVALYESNKIPYIRLFEPHPNVLESLRVEGLKVVIGVKNDDVPNICFNVNTAIEWVNTNIVPYASEVNFGWIAVGNNMVPGPNANLLFGAMNNILSGLNEARLTNIKISTIVSNKVLQAASSPIPSTVDFTDEARDVMKMIIVWLNGTNNPLLIKVDAYSTYVSNPGKIPLNYAVFDTNEAIVKDGVYEYVSLFEAMVDSFYVALEKHGGSNVNLVVAETGWPSAGNEPHTSISNAFNYNQGIVTKMRKNGTPRRIDDLIDIFIFSMFNENNRPQGVGRHWGIYYPNATMVYDLDFS